MPQRACPPSLPEPGWNAVYYDSPRSLTPKLAPRRRTRPGRRRLLGDRLRAWRARLYRADLHVPRRRSPGAVSRPATHQNADGATAQPGHTRPPVAAGAREARRRSGHRTDRWTPGAGAGVAAHRALDAPGGVRAGRSRSGARGAIGREGHAHALDAPHRQRRGLPPPVAGDRSQLVGGSRRQDRATPPNAEAPGRAAERVAEAFTAEPRGLGELREHLGETDGMAPDEVLWWIRRSVAFAHAPSDVPWSFGRRPRPGPCADPGSAPKGGPPTDEVVRTPGPSVPRGVRAGDGRGCRAMVGAGRRLRCGQGSRRSKGPGSCAASATSVVANCSTSRARRSPTRTRPAPPRLLPMWDSTLLAFADGRRLISDADRRVVIARNGDTLPTFTVDGVVAGLWWAAAAPGGRTRIVIEPFRPPLRRGGQRALEAEGGAAGRHRRAPRTGRVCALPALAPPSARLTGACSGSARQGDDRDMSAPDSRLQPGCKVAPPRVEADVEPPD